MQVHRKAYSVDRLEEGESKANPSNSSFFSWVQSAGLAIVGSVQKALGFAASDFAQNLEKENFQRVFAGSTYEQCPSYEAALRSYRENYRAGAQPDASKIAVQMFQQPLWDLAYETLEPYFVVDREDNGSTNFADTFIQDAKIVQTQLRPEVGQGGGYTTGLKLTAYTSLFDAHKNGNYPYLAGCRYINGKQVNVLRHGVPVREWLDTEAIVSKSSSRDSLEEGKPSSKLCNSCVAEEYRAFLDYCKDQGKKVLYNCLLNPKNNEGDEGPRMEALFKLGLEEQYRDTYHFVRIPADGPLTKGCKDPSSLQSYKELISKDIERLREWSDQDFQSWEALSKKDLSGFVPGSSQMRNLMLLVYEPLLNFAYQVILDSYVNDYRQDLGIAALQSLLKEKKQAFMMLFCTLLKMRLMQRLGITDYNNTCKDAIDRGAMHLVCDFLWDSFVTGDLKRSEDNLRVHAAWPAVMAKSQAILHDRAEWIVSFARWIDRVSTQPTLKQKIFKACKQSKLVPDRPVNFLNSYKSESYMNRILSKCRDDFAYTRTFHFKVPCEDTQTLISNQDPVRNLLLNILPSFLEHMHYHNIPLKQAPESVIDIMNRSEDAEFISGELGFFSNEAGDFVGGPVFTITAEKGTIGEIEVALKWKIYKKDLGKNPLPIELSIRSRYTPHLKEEFEILEERGEEKSEGMKEDVRKKPEDRKRAILEKQERQREPLEISQAQAASFALDLEVEGNRQELEWIDRVPRRSFQQMRSKSENDLRRGEKDVSPMTTVSLQAPVDSSQDLGDISELETGQPYSAHSEAFVSGAFIEEEFAFPNPPQTPPSRVRMGRDIVMLGTGALLGSAITVWSKIFGGFSKSNPSASDSRKNAEAPKDNSVSKNPVRTSDEIPQQHPSVASILQSMEQILDPIFPLQEMGLNQCMSWEEPKSLDSKRGGFVSIPIRNESSKAFRKKNKVQSYLYPLVVSNPSNLQVPPDRFLEPVLNGSASLLAKSIVPFVVPSPNKKNHPSNHSSLTRTDVEDLYTPENLVLLETTIHTKPTENSVGFPLIPFDVPSFPTENHPSNPSGTTRTDTIMGLPIDFQTLEIREAKSTEDIDPVKKDSVQDIPGFSTTFKMMAGAMVGVGVVVLAVKIYRYFQDQKHKLEKIEKTAMSPLPLQSPEPLKVTGWEKTLLDAQDFVETVFDSFLKRKRVAKNVKM